MFITILIFLLSFLLAFVLLTKPLARVFNGSVKLWFAIVFNLAVAALVAGIVRYFL